MPLLQPNSFQRPKYLVNGHLETIYPALFRKVNLNPTSIERIETPDGDFLEIDWHQRGNSKLVIISHGLEGNSRRAYVLGMAKEALKKGFDVLAWNYRGCGEHLNKKEIFYHSGATYDLETIIQHALPHYSATYLIGFSLGGNLTLKYLGENRVRDPKIKRGVAISVPLDLGSSCDRITKAAFGLYTHRFLKSLRNKVERKSQQFPNLLDLRKFSTVKSLRDFDGIVTGPWHGFNDAEEYYQLNSSLQFLPTITIPTLILNAENDPFLSTSCYPKEMVQKLDQVYLECQKYGGHVGFSMSTSNQITYSESRAVEFICQDS